MNIFDFDCLGMHIFSLVQVALNEGVIGKSTMYTADNRENMKAVMAAIAVKVCDH